MIAVLVSVGITLVNRAAEFGSPTLKHLVEVLFVPDVGKVTEHNGFHILEKALLHHGVEVLIHLFRAASDTFDKHDPAGRIDSVLGVAVSIEHTQVSGYDSAGSISLAQRSERDGSWALLSQHSAEVLERSRSRFDQSAHVGAGYRISGFMKIHRTGEISDIAEPHEDEFALTYLVPVDVRKQLIGS